MKFNNFKIKMNLSRFEWVASCDKLIQEISDTEFFKI